MFHRDHIVRFLKAAELHTERQDAILQRVDNAIAKFNSDEKVFPGGRLGEVLGDAELTDHFNTMWNDGKLWCEPIHSE